MFAACYTHFRIAVPPPCTGQRTDTDWSVGTLTSPLASKVLYGAWLTAHLVGWYPAYTSGFACRRLCDRMLHILAALLRVV